MTEPPSEVLVGLSAGQAEAVWAIYRWYYEQPAQEFFLAGEAGTGKTTIAARLVRGMGLRTAVAAYTGKAASVLRKKGLWQAGTIHSLIYTREPGTEPPRWVRNPESALTDARLLALDECSMCDYSIAEDLRAYGRKILVLGDLEQLPPIQGQGAFTARPPDYTLTEVHRQAAESPVLRLAGAARRGFRLEDALVEGDDRARIIRLGRRELLEAAERGAQVICGVHRSRWGATKLIREHLGFKSGFPESGDRVICRRNDRELGIYNGMLGTVLEVYDADNWRVNFRVRMDDTGEELDVWSDATLFREHTEGKLKPPLYQREVQLFDFGFVITCHSAQGSEWDEVVIIDDSQRFGDEARRWLYTAITRAAERVTLLRRGE